MTFLMQFNFFLAALNIFMVSVLYVGTEIQNCYHRLLLQVPVEVVEQQTATDSEIIWALEVVMNH
jgi:hypothetical protein